MDVTVKGVGEKIEFVWLGIEISVREQSDESWVNFLFYLVATEESGLPRCSLFH
jgi:hypothetical protein